MNNLINSYNSMILNGFVVFEELFPKEQVQIFLNIAKENLNKRLAQISDKQLGIGSKEGFKEICQRSPGRWDVPIDLEDLNFDHKKTPWWSLIAKLLGDDATAAFQGIVSSEPQTPAQNWHIDSPHTNVEHQPPHMINILIALENIDLEMGPPEIAIGTHKFTNHLKNQDLISDELVYQCDKTTPSTLQSKDKAHEFKTWTAALKAGSCVLFDDRVLHRGGENKSEKIRHVGYFSYLKNGHDQKNYFESQKSLNNLSYY